MIEAEQRLPRTRRQSIHFEIRHVLPLAHVALSHASHDERRDPKPIREYSDTNKRPNVLVTSIPSDTDGEITYYTRRPPCAKLPVLDVDWLLPLAPSRYEGPSGFLNTTSSGSLDFMVPRGPYVWWDICRRFLPPLLPLSTFNTTQARHRPLHPPNMKSLILLISLFISLTLAFPTSLLNSIAELEALGEPSSDDAKKLSEQRTNCGPTPCSVFNAEEQLVSVSGKHAYQSPSARQIRGPLECNPLHDGD